MDLHLELVWVKKPVTESVHLKSFQPLFVLYKSLEIQEPREFLSSVSLIFEATINRVVAINGAFSCTT